ncbi:MAG: Ig-like domain-containing protein [Novosphingobium sp.]
MPVAAKISSDLSAIHSAPVQTVESSISVAPGSNIVLNVSPEAVAGYSREGMDLLVQLRTGEVVRIANFYADAPKLSQLMLVQEDHLVVADVVQAAGGALASPTYVPIDAMAGFAAPATTGATGVIAGAAAGGGGLGAGMIVPLAALGSGGLIAMAVSNGDEAGEAPATPGDTVAPVAPTNLVISLAGDSLSGRAEAGATVLVDTDGNGTADYMATVAGDGTFTVTLNPALVNAETISVAIRDAAGNVGPVADILAPDLTAPNPAMELTVAADGTGITGTGEAGAIVSIDIDGDGEPEYNTIITAQGTFSILFVSPLDNGQAIAVKITDAAGNASIIATAQAPDVTPAPDTAPTVNPTNGSILTGNAQSGIAVVLSNASGHIIGQASVSATGAWSFTPQPSLADSTIVTIAAINAEGEAGPAVSVTVDAIAPDAPILSPSNGTEVSGTAEVGTTILVTDDNGAPIGQAVANAAGEWSVVPANPLSNGTVLTAKAFDAAGNASLPSNTTVDAVPPPAPTLAAPNATTVSGTAEANSIVMLFDGNGNQIGEIGVDQTGAWTFAPSAPLADGSAIIAVARDAAGNTSPPVNGIVDAIAPAAPEIAPSRGDVISGTGEPGAIVTLTNGNGSLIGQVLVNGAGSWTFTPNAPLPDGSAVNAVARDAAGNVSTSDSMVIDSMSPLPPEIAPTSGTIITGFSEAGASIVLTDSNGSVIGQTIADADGRWSFLPTSSLAHGTIVNAMAQDVAGNSSIASSTTVDAIAPDAPRIDATDGSQITGTAEPNSALILIDGNGNSIGETSADSTGNWSLTPDSPLTDGTEIIAKAQDAAGNVSPSASTTVDSSPPAEPTINPTNGSVVTGTAEPNSTVVLMDGTGNPSAAFMTSANARNSFALAASSEVPDLGPPLGEVATDAEGNWIFIPLLPLSAGTVVIAVSVDAAGNVSGPVETVVDGVAPPAPTINPTTGLILEGTAEPGVTLLLADAQGTAIGEATADVDGNWSFLPDIALPHDTVVELIAIDEAGNASLPTSTIVDAVAPPPPVIDASNGSVLTGTAERGTIVILTDELGLSLGQALVDENGNWAFTPPTPLLDMAMVEATAVDTAGNASLVSSITIDALAPDSPILTLVSGGELLLISAEPLSTVLIVIDGDAANPILVSINANGDFSLPLQTPLIANETISAITIDTAGNESGPTLLIAPDIAPPTIIVAEAEDGYVNASEAADGVQVEVALRPTMQAGQQITATLTGQGGYQMQATHSLSAGDILAGVVVLTIAPDGGFPDGASAISASIGGGQESARFDFIIDTTPPAMPVLSFLASVLTISADPGSQLTVAANVDGLTTGAVVTAGSDGFASLNLLADLDAQLDWAQLLDAQITVTSADPAGNTSSIAAIDVAPNVEQPVTIGNLGIAVSLNPINPQFGVSGTTEPGSTIVVRVATPALNVELLPINADGNGHFTLNLLSPTVLTQLGLSITDILNLGSQISLGMVATDPQGHESAIYGLSLSPNGLSLNLGQIDVNGSSADDIMSGAAGAEHISGSSGNDLILNVGTGDHVLAGPDNDTVEVLAANFSTIDGGSGFDTVLLGNGIDLDYGASGVGTLANIERIDLGNGDSGSVLTLTAGEVNAITDANNTLQITGEGNDVLHISGALDTGSALELDGLIYNVYAFGVNTVLVEDNTVQVIV